MQNTTLTIIAPMYNEAAGIETFINELEKVRKSLKIETNVVLVNDGSKDNTLTVTKHALKGKKDYTLVNLSRNFGHEVAMTAGLHYATGDYIIIMDSDMQDPPSLIPQLYNAITKEEVDVVYARRTSREGESFMKRFTSTLFYRLAKYTTGLNIPDDAGDFRIMTKRVAQALNTFTEQDRNLKMLYAYAGFNKSSIPFDRPQRHAGNTSYNWWKLINAALDSIVAFSTFPLRLMSLSGVGISLILFLYSVFVVIKKLMGGYAVEGWTSLMMMLTLLFAILFLFLAVLSEYLGRVLMETKRRPLYFVQDEFKTD